jgi:hypothetical protein
METMSFSAVLVGLALTVQVPPPQAALTESAVLRSARDAVRERETEQLQALAGQLDAGGRKAEAAAVRARVEPTPGKGSFRFVPLPPLVLAQGQSQGQDKATTTTTATTERKGLANVPPEPPPPAEAVAIQAKSAQVLFTLASQALASPMKHYALADECLRAVLFRDPDQAEARRLLGYVAHDGGWATPFAVEQLRLGRTLHSTYGWVDSASVPHLQQGQLPAWPAPGQKQPRWIPADEANAQRNSIARPWIIKTEHFEIRTDVPLSDTIAFGRQLEAFHDLFFSLMADVIADDLPLARRYRDKARVLPRPEPHLVSYFATKDEYVEYLRPTQGETIKDSLGIYVPPPPGKRRGQAYFFLDRGGQLDVTATLYHEVSHQLLFESTRVGPAAYEKNLGNYWVFEGLGTYFETISHEPDGALRVGGFVSPRIEVARKRLVERAEHVPIDRLVRLDKNAFNNEAMIRLHYAEAMALTVYLMDGRDSQTRENFLDYVRDALHGRLRSNSSRALAERLGIPYKTLDAELLAALQGMPGP